jgi:hypothetical protein
MLDWKDGDTWAPADRSRSRSDRHDARDKSKICNSLHKYLGKQMLAQEDGESVSLIICQTNEERMLASLAGIRLSGMDSKPPN